MRQLKALVYVLILSLLSSVVYSRVDNAVWWVADSSQYGDNFLNNYYLKNISLKTNYSDDRLNIIQDWNLSVYRNGAINLTIPRPIARFTFDYDNYSNVTDRSMKDKSNDGVYHGTAGRMFYNGVIHYFGFEERHGGKYYDWSTNKLNASVPSVALSNYSNCKKGACVNTKAFTTQMINISNKSYNSNLKNFSISVWIYPYTCKDCEIINKERIGYAYFQLAYTQNYAWCSDGCIASYLGHNTQVSQLISSNVNLRNSWHHIVYTYTNWTGEGKSKLYIDGVSVTTGLNQTGTGTRISDVLGDWHVGNQPNLLSLAPFNGSIDELYIFNKTLNTKEVIELYQDSAKYGYSYYFRNNTNEYIQIPNSALWNKWTNMTVCLWMKPTFYQPGATPVKVINKGWAGAGAWAITIANDGETRFAMSDSLSNTFSATWFGSAYQNRWTHVCGVHNQTDALLYINGTLSSVKAKLSGTGFNANTGAIEISSTGITHYRGMIDDIIIYNKSLSSEQINYIYNNSIYRKSPSNGTYNISYHYNRLNGTKKLMTQSRVFESRIQIGVIDDLGNNVLGFNVNLSKAGTFYRVNGNSNYTVLNVTFGTYSVGVYKNGYSNVTYTSYVINRSFQNLTISTSSLFTVNIKNEQTGNWFQSSNVTRARLYINDSNTYIDIKTTDDNHSFKRNNTQTLRLEILYKDGSIINRYVSVAAANMRNITLCANNETVTHYEQLIISGVPTKAVLMKNYYTKCYIAADYTRFAYQNGNVLRAYTIDSNYNIYSFDDDGAMVELSYIDGSIQEYINLDALLFNELLNTIKITSDSIGFKHDSDNKLALIRYLNTRDDNTGMEITITRMDTDTVVYSSSTYANPNDITISYDYTSLSDLTNDTMFLITATVTRNTGKSEVIKRYFNLQGITSALDPHVAFMVALLLSIFGMTFAATRVTFSYFGVFILIGSIGILSLGGSAWYLTLMMVVNVIMLVYTVIVMTFENNPSVT